ncbi:MAG: IPT/TIG domain-containing protein, partial [Prevotellaceae bacterium]|nr:IPT/TIG domain-containing protein [Prevotellaceae bacterium]
KTNQFLFAALAAAFLSVANYATAQVTIGGGDPPKAGAILDLNSTTKGGLALSNVSLTDLNTIPVGFPGINSPTDVTPEVKAKLTGAIVYNINSDICLGVYVWNGNQWRKVDKDYQVKATGSGELTITSVIASEWDAILAGENVKFEVIAPDDVQFYNWYLDGTYLATTSDPEYTSYFPVGSHTMKVELDNCLTLAESNSVAFSTHNLFPAAMPISGGERWIRIYGGDIFPYAATTEYVAQDDLVAHFDGINNTGAGDKNHDFTATAWKDLKNEFSIQRSTGDGIWLSNGFQALDDDESFHSSFFPDTYPINNESRTVEVIFRTPEAAYMFEQKPDTEGGERNIFWYGGTDGQPTGDRFGVLYRGIKRTACGSEEADQWIFYAIFTNSNNMMTCLSSTPSLTTANTINTVTSTYTTRLNNPLTQSYINNSLATVVENGSGSLQTGTNEISIFGSNLSHSTILSIRLYNRVLDRDEIEYNAALDQKRYLAPPTVTIGGSPCTNVTVLSPRVITCLAPSAGSAGKATVVVDKAGGGNLLTLPDEFEYLP